VCCLNTFIRDHSLGTRVLLPVTWRGAGMLCLTDWGFLQRLDYVLSLQLENFMERRLQTLVFKRGLAKSIHHARVLIRQRHIRVGRQIVNVPSFMVRVESQPHIEFALNSPFGGGRPGRVKRRNTANGGGDDNEDDE